jgi:predicted Zn-dependent protease
MQTTPRCKSELVASPHRQCTGLVGKRRCQSRRSPGRRSSQRKSAQAGAGHDGDVNFALAPAQQARHLLPNSPVTADALGWVGRTTRLGSQESAVAQLKDSVREVRDNSIFQYQLGMAYLASGHRDSAQRSLQTALQDNSNFLYAASASQNSYLDGLASPRNTDSMSEWYPALRGSRSSLN